MKIEVSIKDITNLSLKTRYQDGLVTTVTFNAKISPVLLARILNLERQQVPLYANIGSSQAIMDILFEDYPKPPAQGKTER